MGGGLDEVYFLGLSVFELAKISDKSPLDN